METVKAIRTLRTQSLIKQCRESVDSHIFNRHVTGLRTWHIYKYKLMFEPAPNNVSFPKLELDVLEYWKENSIYQRSLKQRQDAPAFVFYEGPPTANGMPHPGHCLTRAIKDLFPRYRTMRGYHCERKAGWDTHGLPVEVEVCKELGIHSKEEIEEYGIEPFIQK